MKHNYKLSFSRNGYDWSNPQYEYEDVREAYLKFRQKAKRYQDWGLRLVRTDGKILLEHSPRSRERCAN